MRSPLHDFSIPPIDDDHLGSRIEDMRRAIETPIAAAEPPRKKHNIMRGLFIPTAIILAWLLITQYRFFNLRSGQTVFVLSEAQVLGPTDLCPGDSLNFSVDVEVLEQGIYQLSMSTWKTSPPTTVVFSEGLDMVIADSREFPIAIEWVVTDMYISPYTGKPTEWEAGEYSRDVAVSAVDRNTTPSIVAIPFTIRSDCP